MHANLVFDSVPTQPNAFYLRPRGDRDQLLAEAENYVLLLHGLGADYSSLLAMISSGQAYQGKMLKASGEPTYGQARILEYDTNGDYKPSDYYVESIAQPGQNFGIDYKSYKHKDEVIAYIVNHLLEVKSKLSPEAKIILHGRSFGGSVSAEVNFIQPGLVDRLILMSPTLAIAAAYEEADQRLKESVELEAQENNGPIAELNREWLDWGKARLSEMKWAKAEKPFGDTPTIIFSGTADPELTDYEALYYETADDLFDHVEYRLIEEAKHDVFDFNSKVKAMKRLAAREFLEALQLSLIHI